MKFTLPFILISAICLISMTSCSEEARKRIHADWTKDPKDLYEYGCYLIAKRPRNFYSDYDEGRKYIEKAANMGYPEAMYGLAAQNAMGLDPKHLPIAVYWYSRAAECGNSSAMDELAKAYRFGLIGLPVDETKARYYFRLRDKTLGFKEGTSENSW